MIYIICRYLCRFVYKFIYRVQITGLEHVPATGGLILAANHKSYLDPPLVGTSLLHRWRDPYFMAKAELFTIPAIKQWLRTIHANPISRGTSDITGFKASLDVIRNGKVLVLFPEGTRNKKNIKIKPKRGVVLLAQHTGVPVVPVKIVNTEHPFAFRKLQVRFGMPMAIDTTENPDDAAQRIVDAIEAL